MAEDLWLDLDAAAGAGGAPAGGALGRVLARLDGPREARVACVLWHGAGSDVDEPALAGFARRLAAGGIAVARVRFPYRQRAADRGRAVPPERLPVLVAAAGAALRALEPRWQPAVRVVGGRSLGARVACHLAADPADPRVDGVLALAYPLHPPRAKRPRATPFAGLRVPLLAFQGGRDPFGGPAALRAALGAADATVVALPAADHALVEPVRTGRTPEAVLDGVAADALDWLRGLAGR